MKQILGLSDTDFEITMINILKRYRMKSGKHLWTNVETQLIETLNRIKWKS